jgi:hypothetical protein
MKHYSGANFLPVLLVGLLSWFLPGAGHWVLRERKRAIIIFVTISTLFTLGLYIGSIGVIDPVREKLWYTAQMLNSPLVAVFGQMTITERYESFGRPNEIGQIYTGIGGMLNLLCIINAIYLTQVRQIKIKM